MAKGPAIQTISEAILKTQACNSLGMERKAIKVKWDVIGAGGIADQRTIPRMMLCHNAELVAVMEINMELAEKCRAKWGCKKAYNNEADLLADPEIDAVYIASPVVMHARQAKEYLMGQSRKYPALS